ncbi:MAG: ankyrin repeat domain-containing protein [Thiobacillus sp.]|nr:ankyrin repeat domain-containing protein [Thiobacillus sp.]
MNDTALKAWLENQGFPSADSLQQTLHGRIANAATPLMHAARMGRIGYIGDLLSRGADPRGMNADGNGALWFACYAGSAPCVNALIKAGAPLDSQNVNGATALIYAASAGKTAIVQLLLDAGADPTPETLDGFTALDLAANRACMKLLRAAYLQAA